jgi:acyl carrier protein
MNDSGSTTLARLHALLAKDFELDAAALQPQTRLEDLDIDSLRMIEILFSVEDTFGIAVPAEQAELRAKVTTVGELAAYIDTLVDAQRKAGEGGAGP